MRIGVKRMILYFVYRSLYVLSRGKVVGRAGSVRAKFEVNGLQELMRVRRHERPLLRRLMIEIMDGDVVWDIGANIGVHAVFCSVAAGEKGKVFAFEPEPNLVDKINKSSTRNPSTNLSVIPFALGDVPGTANLYVDPSDGSGKHTLQDRGGFSPLEIQVRTGDQLIDEGATIQPNIVKIDVEGFELGVLRGMKRSLRNEQLRFLVVEVHPVQIASLGEDVDEVKALLLEAGFTEFSESGRGREHHLFASK